MTAIVFQIHPLGALGFDGDCATCGKHSCHWPSRNHSTSTTTRIQLSHYKRRHLAGGAFWIVFLTCSPFHVDNALPPPSRLIGESIYSISCVVYIVLPFVPIIHPLLRWLPVRSWHFFSTAYCRCSLQSSKPVIQAILLLVVINDVTRDRSVLP